MVEVSTILGRGDDGSRVISRRDVLNDVRFERPITTGRDRVEISRLNDDSGAPIEAPRIRGDLVERLRQRIARGDYLSEAKIDATVDVLHAELTRE